MQSMKLCNYLVSIGGILVGGLIMLAASKFPLAFTENGPGPGFWPFSLGMGIFLGAILLLGYSVLKRDSLERQLVALTLAANKRVYLMMGLMVLFCILINLLGFYIASAVVIPLVMQLMDYHDKKVMAMTTVGTLAFIYLVFGMLLNTQMPESIFLE